MHQTVMGHLAAGEAIIDIDWTAIVQLGLFLLLFLVCNALLFQPYLRLRARRREGIQGAREEAVRMTAEADARLVDYETKLAAARTRAGEEQRKVRAEAAAYERDTTVRLPSRSGEPQLDRVRAMLWRLIH